MIIMRKTIKGGVTFVKVDEVNEEILVELTGCTNTPVRGYISLSYMNLWNRYDFKDDDKLTICVETDTITNKPGMFILVRRTGRIFWFENPRLTNSEPAYVTTTWGHLKAELQKCEPADGLILH